MSLSELADSNPWWTNRHAIDQVKEVAEWSTSAFRWIPRLSKTIEWDVDVVYVLRGPRQVGKTTLIKLKIRELLEAGLQPRRIFYWACDFVESPEKLASLVTSYISFVRKNTSERLYIFLDEISSVKDWQKGIKTLVDRGILKNCTLVLTGSHSIDLRRATETLGRRRGDVDKLKDKLPDKILLPMKFSEFAENRSGQIQNFLQESHLLSHQNREKLWTDLLAGKIPNLIEELLLISKEVERLFSEYLITGGIPRAISSYINTGSISQDVYDGYVELVIRDIRRYNGNEVFLRQILRRLFQMLSTPVSLNNLRQETDISSHHTTGTYLDFLRDTYVVSSIYKLDLNKESPVFRNARKIHFGDPFLFHSLRAWCLGREPFAEAVRFLSEAENVSKLIENVVANHFIRMLFGYYPSIHFDYTNRLFYWQSKKHELDFAMLLNGKYTPLEVKYQSRISVDDSFPIVDFQKAGKSTGGLLLTKDTVNRRRSYVELPVHIGLLLI